MERIFLIAPVISYERIFNAKQREDIIYIQNTETYRKTKRGSFHVVSAKCTYVSTMCGALYFNVTENLYPA